MDLKIFSNEIEVGKQAAAALKKLCPHQGRLTAFLPTGNTPKPLYTELRRDAAFWKDKLEVFQIDDYVAVGLTGAFRREIEAEVIEPLGLKAFFHPIPPRPDLFEAHGQRTISDAPMAAVLGLGPNGHVGFHEPQLPGDFAFGSVELDASTKSHLRAYNQRIGEKDFAPGSQVTALTFGVGTFKRCENVLLIVTGDSKAQVLKALFETAPQSNLPASLLKDHSNICVFADEKAARLVAAHQNK